MVKKKEDPELLYIRLCTERRDPKKDIKLSDVCGHNGCKRKRAKDSLVFCRKCKKSIEELCVRMAKLPLEPDDY